MTHNFKTIMPSSGFIFCLIIIIDTAASQVVELDQGSLRGTTLSLAGTTVFSFKGIPYAQPPVAEKRFQRSVPHQGWMGTYPGFNFGPPCPQPSGSRAVRDSMREDCLFLNVWTNHIPFVSEDGELDSSRLRPVIVLIEGQLFTLGNPSDVPAEDLVVDQDLVVVSVSYRINAFGFLSFGSEEIAGNAGLWDQYLAILWVYENIDRFGGDRDQITLLGHSAGAASVLHHVISSKSRPYLKGAIMMSGSALAPWALQPRARENAARLAEQMECKLSSEDRDKEARECLQAKSMQDIISGVDNLIRDGNVTALFSPVVDSEFMDKEDYFIPRSPSESLRLGAYKKLPMLAGLLADDGVLMAYFIKESVDKLEGRDIGTFLRNTLLPSVISQLPSSGLAPPQMLSEGNETNLTASLMKTSLARNLLSFQYFRGSYEGVDKDRVYDDVINFFNEVYFVAPLLRQLELTSDSGGAAYFYTNTFRSPDIFGNRLNRTTAAHGSDLLFLFGPEMYRKFFNRGFESFSESRLARNSKALFGSFALTGAPPRSLNWPQYGTTRPSAYYDVGSNALGRGYRERAADFWFRFLPATLQGVVDLMEAAANGDIDVSSPIYSGSSTCSTYITLTWLLLVAVIVLIIIFLLVVWMMKKTASDMIEPSRSVFSVSGRSMDLTDDHQLPPHLPGSGLRADSSFKRSRGGWRESVTDYRL